MKKYAIWASIITLVFLISTISACQYTENKPISREVLSFYENGELLDYNLLEAKDFTTGSFSNWFASWNPPPSFKVYNNYQEQINVTINYVYYGESKSSDILIDSKGYTSVTYDSDPNRDRTFNQNSITYDIHNSGLESKRENLFFDNFVCKTCPNGKECLDDGQNCSSNSECGSNVCNPDNKCGKPEDFKGCPTGKVLRDKLCVDGAWTIFKKNIPWIILVLLCLGISSFFLIRAIHEKIKKGIIVDGKKEAERIINNAQIEAQKIIRDSKEKLKNLNDKIEEKQNLELQLKNEEQTKEKAKKIRAELKKTVEDISRISEEKINEINNLLNSYRTLYGRDFIFDNGYIRFAKSPRNENEKGEYFHRWLYRTKKGNIKPGYEIHHKDFNKLNNNLENLEELTPEEHQNKHIHRYR